MAFTEQDWIDGFLAYIGAPSTGDNDGRVQWLLAQIQSEGTFSQGNEYNPLDITGTYGEPGEGDWGGPSQNGGDPVQTFPTAAEGYKALVDYLSNKNDIGILNVMKKPGATISEVYQAYANSQWNGKGTAAMVANVTSLLSSNSQAELDAAGINSGGDVPGATPSVKPSNTPYTGPEQFYAFGYHWDLSAFQPQWKESAYQMIQKFGTEGSGDSKETIDRAEQMFGTDNPQVLSILVWDALGGASQDLMFEQLYNTTWWKTQDASQRNFDMLKADDPAGSTEVINQTYTEVAKDAAALGIELSAAQMKSIVDYIAPRITTANGQATDTSFTSDQIIRLVSAAANIFKQGTATGGDVSDLADSYQKLAGQYMIPLSQHALDQHVQAAIQGDYGQGNYLTGEESGFEQYLKEQAINRYPYMKEQINAGITPYAWADPYRQDAASILQLNPNEINMEDPKFQFALTQINPKTKAKEPMSLADFGQVLRSDPKYGYQYTDDANTKAWNTSSQLLGLMGAIPNGVAGGGTA